MTEPQLVVVFVLVGGIYGAIRAVKSAQPEPDPWGPEVAAALNEPEAVPVCHHCFTPQAHTGWFCPQCGAAVGPYNNYMPYVRIFSYGEVMRAGVSEPFRPSGLLVAGFLLAAVCLFGFFAPVYWWVFLRHRRERIRRVEG